MSLTPPPALTEAELSELGISFGRGCQISRDARFYGADRIALGDNVRIDSFCVLSSGGSGRIDVANHSHIASGARLFGQGHIAVGNFTGISAGSTLFSASDDFSGEFLFGPEIDQAYCKVDERPIVMDDFTLIGAHGLVLPGVRLHEGSVLGAAGVAVRDLDPWTINGGVPAKFIKQRSRGLVAKADAFRQTWEMGEETNG